MLLTKEKNKLKSSSADEIIGSGARDLLQTYLNDVLGHSKNSKITRNLNNKGIY